jgi:hypothetical protein
MVCGHATKCIVCTQYEPIESISLVDQATQIIEQRCIYLDWVSQIPLFDVSQVIKSGKVLLFICIII